MDIIQLKDSVKKHLSQMVDQGVSLNDALMNEQSPMMIEKQVRIDLAHKGLGSTSDNKQIKFKCQVHLQVEGDEAPKEALQ